MTLRKDDIDALLIRAKQELTRIESAYQDSLARKSIDKDLRIDIKNYFENLKSALDYLAYEIEERYCNIILSKRRIYFPIIDNNERFHSKMQAWFPGLRNSCPPLYEYLESIQPYNPTMEWIKYFNKINNENKHVKLIEQTRREVVKETTARSKNGKSVSWTSGVIFSSGVSIMGVPIDPKTQLPVPNPSLEVSQTVWVDFIFSDINVSALWLCKSSITGVTDIVETIFQLL